MIKKKILVHMVTNLGHGGAEAVLYNLVKNLQHLEFEQHVIYFYGGVYVEKLRSLGITTHAVSGLFFQYDPVFFIRLCKLIKSLKPDTLHTLLWAANFFGRIIAYWYNIAHVEVFHNMLELNGRLRNFLDRLTSQFHGKIVAVSPSIATALLHDAPWLSKPVVQVIKNGIETKVDSSINYYTKEDYGLRPDSFIIGTVGRFERVKNQSLLLTVFALLYDQHPEARLMIIGSGSLEHHLRQKAYDLGIDDRVIFIVGQDARPYFTLFDCFVMTSFNEGISMALLEAMLHKVMPIVIAPGKKHDVIKHEDSGLLVADYDVQLCADAIEYSMYHPEQRKLCGESAYATVQAQFCVESMVADYQRLFTNDFPTGTPYTF